MRTAENGKTAGSGMDRLPVYTWLKTGMAALILFIFLAAGSFRSLALDAGAWLVTVKPSYTEPGTGKIEDPGNNEAIGQGMTERLCGSTGLIEVDSSGNMWLTVRYYLSQFVSDVSFEENGGSGYRTISYRAMQTKEPVSGASDITEKYGFTDYRMQIEGLDSVFRGKAYIEPMGRNVVYFLTVSSPEKGSGDFIVTVGNEAAGSGGETAAQSAKTQAPAGTTEQKAAAQTPAGTTEQAAAAQAPAAGTTEQAGKTPGTGEERAGEKAAASGQEQEEPQDARTEQAAGGREERYRFYPDEDSYEETEEILADGINGSGNEDDPVTGIPEKPGTAGSKKTVPETQEALTGGQPSEALTGRGEASPEAKKYGNELLKEAVGITMTVGSMPEAYQEEEEANGYKNVMLVLLGIAAVLMFSFLFSGLKRELKRGGGQRTEEPEEEPASAGQTEEPAAGQAKESAVGQAEEPEKEWEDRQAEDPEKGLVEEQSEEREEEPAKALNELDEIERRQGGLR